jgi:hypothetical protein
VLKLWDDIAFGNYVAGQADADSSFVLFVAQDSRRAFGVRTDVLWIMTKTYDSEILKNIRDFLGVGHVYERPKPRHRLGHRQSGHQLIVFGANCLRIVEFFEKFPLRANKRMDLELWKRATKVHCQRKPHTRWKKADLIEMVKIRLQLDALPHRLKRPGKVDVHAVLKHLDLT